MHWRAAILLAMLGLEPNIAKGAEGDEDPAGAAAELSRLRTEVDELAHRLEAERRRARDVLSALRTERAELARQLRLERIRRATLERLEAERLARVERLEVEGESRLQPIRRALARARDHVESGLPFRRRDRLRQLRAIEASLAAVEPATGEAMARLWRFVEEEAQLTRELAWSQQPIVLEGERQLVDVARVGMALLYFRTKDGRVGWARAQKGSEQWVFETVEEAPLAASIRDVLEAFEDNRTFGAHRLAMSGSSVELLP